MNVYQGTTLKLLQRRDGFVELCFDREGESINKFDDRTTAELGAAVRVLAGHHGLRGVLVTSAKESFIVGADITEFESRFRVAEDELTRSLWASNEFFMAFEDLRVPSVVAIDGFALGGGCEMALACTYRVMAVGAHIGLPEVKLGLFPGFGGTVRLPRVASSAIAIDWILNGQAHDADNAMACSVVDVVCAPDALRTVALDRLHDAVEGRLDWRTRQAAKRAPVPAPSSALDVVFQDARAACESVEQNAYHQPAARMAIELMAETVRVSRDAAQWQECIAFSKVVRTQAGRAMVQTFLNDQFVKRASKALTRQLKTPLRVALPAARGTFEAITDGKAIELCDAGTADVLVRHDAEVLAADESAPCLIVLLGSTSRLATSIAGWSRSDHVVGLRLHRPAGARALAEIVRGPATSDHAAACATTVAIALGATPVVVRDDPFPLLERLLAPHRAIRALIDGDPQHAARWHGVLRSFGWPGKESCAIHGAACSRSIYSEEIVDHLVAPMVIAAALALESGMVATPAELDVAVSLGADLPAYLGGPLQMADHFGLAYLVERIERNRSSGSLIGSHAQPTPGMRERARTGKRYYQNGVSK